jgi:hypothetical protein
MSRTSLLNRPFLPLGIFLIILFLSAAQTRSETLVQQQCSTFAQYVDKVRWTDDFERAYAPRAEAACQRALQERPSPRAYDDLGRALASQQQHSEAIIKFRIAADQGYSKAQTHLGQIYEGVSHDDTQAVFWYRKAAEQGEPRAQARLGIMYSDGRGGLPQDHDQAVFWFRKAAEQEDEVAMGQLAFAYVKGNGVEKSDAVSRMWMTKQLAIDSAQMASAARLESWLKRQSEAANDPNLANPKARQNLPRQSANTPSGKIALDCELKGNAKERGSVVIDLSRRLLIRSDLETLRQNLPLTVTDDEIRWAEDGFTYVIVRATTQVHVTIPGFENIGKIYVVWYCNVKERI